MKDVLYGYFLETSGLCRGRGGVRGALLRSIVLYMDKHSIQSYKNQDISVITKICMYYKMHYYRVTLSSQQIHMRRWKMYTIDHVQ